MYKYKYNKYKKKYLNLKYKLIGGKYDKCDKDINILIYQNDDYLEFNKFNNCKKNFILIMKNNDDNFNFINYELYKNYINKLPFGLLFNNEYVIHVVLFEKLDEIKMNFLSGTNIKKINIPNLKIIPNSFMNRCNELITIRLPIELQKIDLVFMNNCDKISSIILPNNLEEIGSNFMINCKNLKYVKLPKNIKKIFTPFIQFNFDNNNNNKILIDLSELDINSNFFDFLNGNINNNIYHNERIFYNINFIFIVKDDNVKELISNKINPKLNNKIKFYDDNLDNKTLQICNEHIETLISENEKLLNDIDKEITENNYDEKYKNIINNDLNKIKKYLEEEKINFNKLKNFNILDYIYSFFN